MGPAGRQLPDRKVSRDGSVDRTSRRATEGWNFPPLELDRAHAVLDVVKTVAARREASVAQVSLAWLLAQSAVTSVVVGARTAEQLTDSLGAVELTLTAEDLAELDEVSRPPISYPTWLHAGFAPARYPQS